jgi:hypothetical protein
MSQESVAPAELAQLCFKVRADQAPVVFRQTNKSNCIRWAWPKASQDSKRALNCVERGSGEL